MGKVAGRSMSLFGATFILLGGGFGLPLNFVLPLHVESSALAQPASDEGDDQEARVHFRLGRAYYESGRFDDAAREFQQAYRLSGRPALLYNIFVSHRDAGNLREATEALREYLRLNPDARDREQLTARLATMERLVSERGEATTESETDPGADATDTENSTQSSTETAGGVETGEPAGEAIDAPSTSRVTQSEGGGGELWIPGFIIAGAGGLMLAGSLVTGLLALRAQTELEEEYNCVQGECDPGFEAEARDGALLAGATDVLIIGGVVAATTGLILAFVLAEDGEEDRSDVGASAGCDLNGCAGQLWLRF